ncbi:hypothetical protein BGX38DRAFT_1149019 [Terfezia claveryi]|nr:hypothetical protein BGX38DRAFT_1149019 [Terfezia claveryi]
MVSLEYAPLRNSKHTLFLDEPPACILIAPSDPSLVVIGTYVYDTEKGTKSGSLRLYRKSAGNSNLYGDYAACALYYLLLLLTINKRVP